MGADYTHSQYLLRSEHDYRDGGARCTWLRWRPHDLSFRNLLSKHPQRCDNNAPNEGPNRLTGIKGRKQKDAPCSENT